MSTKIYPQGEAEFTLAALDDLAVYSDADFKVYLQTDYANFPSTWELNTSGEGGIESTIAAISAARKVRIEAGGSAVLYQEGTEATILERRGLRGQGTPGVLDTTGAITTAMIASGIITSAAATLNGTLPSFALMESGLEMKVGESIDWSIIKVGANTFSVVASTAHTTVGLLTVATATVGMFRTRKSSATAYITYRIA